MAGRDFTHLDRGPLCGRALLRNRQSVVAVVATQQEEAADHLLGLGEGAVQRPGSSVAHLDPGALGVRGQRFDGKQDAALLQVGGERRHFRIDMFASLQAQGACERSLIRVNVRAFRRQTIDIIPFGVYTPGGIGVKAMSVLRHVFVVLALLATQAGAAMPDPAGIRVATVPVGQSGAGSVLDIDAVLEPQRQATVTAQVGGSVLALRVKAGDAVRRGQALVRLDDREMRANTARSDAAVVQAQAALRDAQQVLERNRELRKSGFLSAAALDGADNQVRSAQAAVGQAQAARTQATVAQGFAELVAPFDAVVLATHVETGDLALPGRALITLYQPGLLRAVAYVPASRVAEMAASTEVQVVLPDGSAVVPTAREMQPTADPVSQTVEWRLPLPATATGLRPGQMVRVRATGAAAAATDAGARLTVPREAILRRGELTAVYVASDKGFILRAVRVGSTLADRVEVLAGLRSGERIARDPVRAGLPGAIAE